jgi:hypothetical protein
MHFYCGDCIRRTLETILEMGQVCGMMLVKLMNVDRRCRSSSFMLPQFPAYCPQCRAESGGLPEPEKGRIEGPALSFLRGRGVIDKALQYRFLVEAASIRRDEYLKCPQESCHQYLKVRSVVGGVEFECVRWLDEREREREREKRVESIGRGVALYRTCVRSFAVVKTTNGAGLSVVYSVRGMPFSSS